MRAKISRMQYFFTIPNLMYCKAIGITSGIIARKVGGDTWIADSFALSVGIVLMILMTYLSSRFPEKTIIQYATELLGKWPARLLALILTFFFTVAFATSANVMIIHLKEYFLLQTPLLVVCLAYVLLCMYGAYLGIEVAVRFALLGFFMSLAVNVTTLLGTMRDIRLINLLPLMDKGIVADVSNSIYLYSDMAMPILAVGIMYPMLNSKHKSLSLSFWAWVVGAVNILLWPVMETAVLGPDLMQKYIVVCMTQVRAAQFTKYLPRYELLMMSFFAFSIYVQSVTMFHCAKHSIKQMTGIKKDWHIIIPLGIISLGITYLMIYDRMIFVDFLTYPWPQVCAALSIGLPLLLLLTGLTRGKLKQT